MATPKKIPKNYRKPKLVSGSLMEDAAKRHSANLKKFRADAIKNRKKSSEEALLESIHSGMVKRKKNANSKAKASLSSAAAKASSVLRKKKK